MIITIVVEGGVVQNVEGLPDGWTYLIEDNDINGFNMGVYRREQENDEYRFSKEGCFVLCAGFPVWSVSCYQRVR